MNYQFNPNRDPELELMRFLANAKQERVAELPGLLAAKLGLSATAISASLALRVALAIIDVLFKMPADFLDGLVLKMFSVYQLGYHIAAETSSANLEPAAIHRKMSDAFGAYSPNFASGLTVDVVTLSAQFVLMHWLEQDAFPAGESQRMQDIQFCIMLAMSYYNTMPSRDAVIDDAQSFLSSMKPENHSNLSEDDLKIIKQFIALRDEDAPVHPSDED